MAFKFGTPLDDLMTRSGLVEEEAPQVVYQPTPGGSISPVAYKPPAGSPKYEIPPWFKRLEYAMTRPGKRGACLFGPRGTGKTTAAHKVCEIHSLNCITFQAANGCTIDDLVGTRDLDNGKTLFTEGPLPEALRDDCVLVIEEANAMHPGVFSKLNTLTDGSGDSLRLPDKTRLKPGPGFRVVLAFNEGASYAGMKEVNGALRDRLMPVYTDYLKPEQEKVILMDRTRCDEDTASRLCNMASGIRAARGQLGFDMSPRCLFTMLELVRDLGETWSEAFEHAVLDLVGDPIDKAPQRDAVRQIASLSGYENWPDVAWQTNP